MAEPTPSGGCFTSLLILLAAVFGSFMAAFNSASTTIITPTEITTTVVVIPIGTFTSDELNQAATVMQKRLTSLSLSSATVEVSGDTSINVGLPHVDSLDEVLKTLVARGLLEFVDFSDVPDIGAWAGRDILTTGQGDHPISETAVKNPATNKPFETVLTGDGVKSAKPELNQQFGNQWQITLEFSDEAGKVLGDYTRTHLGKALAIVLDGKVLSVPVIQAEISTQAVITGNFTEQETNRLAVQLAGGALPFEMQVRLIRSDYGISAGTATPRP